MVTKIIPGKPSRLLLNTLAPHCGQKLRSRPLPRLGDVVKRLRIAADQRRVILGYAKERGRFTARRLLAVKAVTDDDEGGIGIELEFDYPACTLSRVLLCHIVSILLD